MKINSTEKVFIIKTSVGEYPVYTVKNAIYNIEKYIKLSANQKALIVTDNGVPAEYAATVNAKIPNGVVLTVPQGEGSKNIETLQLLLKTMVENNFTRTDCVIAVGGGVIGDLAGFAASMFMRGIDFYNVPTTVLSQVDSSVGGKTAIDFMGIKNIVGAFYPPKAVVIDPETLKTLPPRQISNGLAEAVKMALTNDANLFKMFEELDINDNLEQLISQAVLIKKEVVEEDEKESGLRKVLNFGHTLAHGIESANGMENYYHGECVAIGMVPMCSDAVRERLIPILKKLNLPYELTTGNTDDIISACGHDKKLTGKDITVVYVPEIGKFEFRKIPFNEFENTVRKVLS